mmetsp:Transcript_26062/g.61877  ORF Transcript_26062/g.61877 Transcript_26062/m.61877 type:complete len:134 (+) Transcript_26062:65-466(+)
MLNANFLIVQDVLDQVVDYSLISVVMMFLLSFFDSGIHNFFYDALPPKQRYPAPSKYHISSLDLIAKSVLMVVMICYRNQLEIEGLANGVAGVYGVFGCEEVPFSGPLSSSLAVAAGDVVLVVSTFMTYRYPW